jgi:hypothetical protein
MPMSRTCSPKSSPKILSPSCSRYRGSSRPLRGRMSGHIEVQNATPVIIPYVAAEPYDESQYNNWSATDLFAGGLFPVGRHLEFNTYYQHDNDTVERHR